MCLLIPKLGEGWFSFFDLNIKLEDYLINRPLNRIFFYLTLNIRFNHNCKSNCTKKLMEFNIKLVVG